MLLIQKVALNREIEPSRLLKLKTGNSV
jgi:hypothetical protein